MEQEGGWPLLRVTEVDRIYIPIPETEKQKQRRIRLASSDLFMRDMVNELKSFARRLSTHELNPRMAFALVLYRDHPPQDSSFVTQYYPLTEDLDEIQYALDRASAGGGGDGPEAVVDGLHDALYRTSWREGAHKVILLAGDAPPQGVGASGDGFPGGCPCGHHPLNVAREALEKGISIFSLGIGSDSTMRRSFEQISAAASGTYVSLDSASMLIDKVLKITLAEFGKVDIDRLVYRAYRPKITAAEIARTTGLSVKDVEESMIRLRKKEMIRA
jgi:hypothetical protein